MKTGPSTMQPTRLLLNPPLGGAINMAIDEALLESAAERGVATLRLYQWREPTLSLGYFQPYADRAGHATSLACPCVRRRSGGGAIVHDQELTYSLCLPARHPATRDPVALYNLAHWAMAGLIEQHYGVWPRPYGGVCSGKSAREAEAGPAQNSASIEEPFLCFLRRTACDLVLPEPGSPQTLHKICGSAQRRLQGAVLQHGSLLLGCSAAAPELPGLKEMAGRSIPIEILSGWLAERFSEFLGELRPTTLTPEEVARANEVVADRFDFPAWTHRR